MCKSGTQHSLEAYTTYTKGRFVETALFTLVFNIKKALEYKEYTIGVLGYFWSNK